MDFTADELAAEEWRPVVGYEGYYEVSDLGRVRSLDRVGNKKSWKGRPIRFIHKGRILKRFTSGPMKYPAVKLHCEGDQVTRTVHRIVCQAFLGEMPEGYETRHSDGTIDNCRLSNLSYSDHGDNSRDKWIHQTMVIGTEHPLARLTEEDVRFIRSARGKITQRELGEMFSMAGSRICAVQLKKSYYNVPQDASLA